MSIAKDSVNKESTTNVEAGDPDDNREEDETDDIGRRITRPSDKQVRPDNSGDLYRPAGVTGGPSA